MSYGEFVKTKLAMTSRQGIDRPVDGYQMFPHQIDLVRWALRRGAAAIFADTGLGKSRMQVAWANEVQKHTGQDVLILAPLAVAEQTVEEAASIGVKVTHAREESDLQPGLNITNYDRIHKFDCSRFAGVVLDESSIIKHHTAKTLQTLLTAFRHTPFKLCATATPAPNDWTELGNHAEFLGVRSRSEMLAEFFIHDAADTGEWRLKGHARHLFWRWVSSWGAMVRSPADLGHDASLYALPALNVTQHTIELDHNPEHGLFAMEAQTLMERRDARRQSMSERVEACVRTVMETSYGVETGVLENKTREVSNGSGISIKAESSVDNQSGGEKGLYGRVLQDESIEVPKAQPGGASEAQRNPEEEIRRGCCVSVGTKISVEGLARSKPAEATCSTSEEIRNNTGSACGDSEVSGGRMCDMRALGNEREDVPDAGSLPQHREGSRDSLLSLQHGSRKVQRQSGIAAKGNRVLTTPWLIWCDLNAEQDMLEGHFGGLAFSVRGSDDESHKESAIRGWLRGDRPVMISKVSIMGFGLNFQHCNHMAFVGVTDSFESYYQAVRRCWRFGQTKPVNVHIYASNLEGAIVANLKRKEADAKTMADAMALETMDAVRSEVLGRRKETNDYAPKTSIALPSFLKAA